MKDILKGIIYFIPVLLLLAIWNYHQSNSLDTFAIGETISKYEKSTKFVSSYHFGEYSKTLNYQKVKGSHQSFRKPQGFKLNETYLVGFDSKNPDNSYIFYDLPISVEFKIDSLNKCCSPSDFLKLKDRIQ